MTLTVLGASHAKVGAEFTYAGETDESCAGCRLRRQCQNLAVGRAYRVTRVRVEHRDVCSVFEGSVRVVDVEKIPVRVAIPATAMKGTAWRNRFEECGASCLFKRMCNPQSVPLGTSASATLLAVEGPVPCKVGRDLRFAQVSP